MLKVRHPRVALPGRYRVRSSQRAQREGEVSAIWLAPSRSEGISTSAKRERQADLYSVRTNGRMDLAADKIRPCQGR